MDLEGIGLEGVEWIYLVQNMGYWRTLVNRVYSFGFYKIGVFIDLLNFY
jgi:hypothetical protein